MVLSVYDVSVCISVSVGNPNARAGAHHWLQGSHHTAGRDLDFDFLVFPIVDIRLPVGDDEYLVSGKVIPENRLECGCRPAHLTLIPHTLVGFEFVNERTKILGHRL